jgi:hypothetical protein
MGQGPAQLPVLPDPRPPGQCRACLLPIGQADDYAAINAPHTGDHGLLCGPCWAEGRAQLQITGARKRERRLHTVPPRG